MKKLLPLLLLLFSTLYASTTALPTLVPKGESLKNFNKNYYITDKSSIIQAVAISRDGKYIVSGSYDKSLKIWDSSTGNLLRILEGHTGIVQSVAISEDGKTIVSGSWDKSLKIWDSGTGELKRSLEGHTGKVNSVAISRDGKTIVSGSWDKSLKIWDSGTGELLRSLEGHKNSKNPVAISQDGKTIVSGSYSKLKIWDSSTGELLRSLEGHKLPVSSIAISRNGKTIVSGSRDKSVKIWDSGTGELLRSLEGHTGRVSSVAISEDGKTIVSGSGFMSHSKSVKIWDSSTGELLRSLEGHKDDVNSVAISEDGKTIVSGSGDGSNDDNSIKIWDSNTGELLRSLNERHRSYVTSVVISEDGKTIVSGSGYMSYSNSVKIWDSSTGELLRSLEGHKTWVTSVAISRDGKTIVSGSNDDSVKIWDSSTGELLRSLEGHKDDVNSVAISRDGKTIVSGSNDDSIKIWDRGTGELIRSLEGHKSYINSVAISRDGKTIVSGSRDGSIKIWDSGTGELLRSLEGNTLSVTSVAISRDGKTIVSGSSDKSIKIWDRSTGELERSLTGHTEWVSSVAISRDGKTIVSGSSDKSIKIWDRNKTTALKSLIGGQRGNWLVKNHEEDKFYRGDDGTLLLEQKSFKPVQAQWYVSQKSVDNVNLSVKNRHLKFNNNQKAKLVLQLKNLDQNISVLSLKGESEHFVVIPKRVGVLKASETREVTLDVFAKVSRDNPQFIENEELNLSCTTPKGEVFNLSVFVSIDFSTLKVERAILSKDEKTFSVKVRNVGNKALAKAKVKLEAPFAAASQDLENLEVDGNKTFLFSVPPDANISINEKSPFKFSVSIANEEEIPKNPAGTKIAPAYVWHFDNGHVTISLDKLAWYIYALWVLTGLVVLGLIFYFRRYRNTLVLQLQNNPKSLLTLSPTLLSEAKEKLAKINELESVLKSVGIEEKQLDEAIGFDEHKNQAELFAKRIPKSYLLHEGEQHKLACQKTELSVDDFLLYFTSQNANEIEEQFKEDGNRVFVVGSEEEREDIATLARDKTNNIIAPTQVQWSEFLLSPKSQEVLMKILAECLEFSSISPYQTSKGVNKEVDFFGRIKIVRDIKMNSNRNYMIVGGRQLGKSSILKKLERAYTESTSVDCRFINLEAKKGNIVLAMAQSFGLEAGASLEDVYNYIYQSDKKMLLLIDEVDQFIEPEIERDYETLKTLKNLAEEGKATFVFAGYWTLYQYVVADYLSPLYNFGELIVLEGLEKEACRELMIKPMKRIGLKHEDEKYLDEVIEACGQRANLIATICDEVLKEHEGKVIQKTELKKAMQSSSVRDKLLGWDNMDALDKVIIYLTIEKNAFEFDEVLSLLEEEGIEVEASVVKKSLDRLVIAYILKRDEELFSYRVPLMKESVLKTNAKGRRALLDELVGKF